MADFIKSIEVIFRELPFGKKIGMFFLLVFSVAGVILMVVWAQRPDYQVLFSSISVQDSTEIVALLQQRNVPYKVSADGRAVMVPSKDVYEMRMQIASEGFPQGGGVGFEIFDKTNFGVSEFVQKLNFKRALQGELVRTINQLAEVEFSRIHIVTPEKSLFVEDQKKTTASVMLKLKGGRRLRHSQVQGIVHLVASSVEGLNSADITVIDVHGEILFGGQASSTAAQLSSTQLEYKQNVEKDIEHRIQTMLERITGPHSAIVRVSAEVDFQQIEKTEENFNPDSQVARSEQRTEESSSGGAGIPGGVAGLEANIPGGAGGGIAGGGGSRSVKTKETINYEINKVVRHIIEPVGKIENLSVAVVIDGTYEGEGEEKAYKARTPEEMKTYKDIVSAAVGYDEKRGDAIKVENIQFIVADTAAEEEELAKAAKTERWFTIGKYVFAAIVIFILIMYVMKPLLRWITEVGTGLGGVAAGASPAPGGGEAVMSASHDLDMSQFEDTAIQEKKEYRKRVQDIASSDPDRTAELVRRWIKGGR